MMNSSRSIAGEIKETEVFFKDDNFTAFIKQDRAYVKFPIEPKRQLKVALKSRGWWWNAYEKAYGTYLERLDKDWVASIGERYSNYL